MDIIRQQLANKPALVNTADNVVNIESKLAKYIRDKDYAASILMDMIEDKKQIGHLHKDQETATIGTNHKQYQPEEVSVLKMTMYFIKTMHDIVRYNLNALPNTASNQRITFRVYHKLIKAEQFHLVYPDRFSARSPKSLGDKIMLFGKYKGNARPLTDLQALAVQIGWKEQESFASSDGLYIYAFICVHLFLFAFFRFGHIKSMQQPRDCWEASKKL